MKKRMIIFVRVVLLILVIVCISLVVYFRINRIKGSVAITINGEPYKVDCIECKYNDKYEGVKYKNNDGKLKFKNKAFGHGMYEYSFSIRNEDINITPKIKVFKSNAKDMINADIKINVYKNGDLWNADMNVSINGYTYTESFVDIKNKEIQYRVE